MVDASGLTPVHRIIDTYSRAVAALGLDVPPLFVERWGVAVHQALSSRAREFHTHQHVLELVQGADALETLAALYHDLVYVQVDLGLPPHYAELLSPLLTRETSSDQGWRLLPHAGVDPTARDVLAVFGRQAGEVLTPLTGLNELASALVAARELEGVLSREQLVAVAACIEASIPFRDGDLPRLAARLAGMGLSPESVGVMLRRAVRLANNDVGNFADPDPARFLDNTWKLLPETNPSLHVPTAYTVRDYRVALMKMEGFLSTLAPERVFRTWAGEPATPEHQRRVAAAARNVDVGVRYLRCKLYSTTVLEALAEASGGDAPVPYFIGGGPDVPRDRARRLEQFLPAVTTPPSGQVDPVLQGLLRGGRATASSFDIAPSPVADHLYAALGEPRMLQGFEESRAVWDRKVSPRLFLSLQPRQQVLAIVEALCAMAPTRVAALQELTKRL